MRGWNDMESGGGIGWGVRLCCVLFLVVSACAPTPRASTPAAPPAVEETAGDLTPGPFWVLKDSADAPPRMYFLGSVHAASPDMFPLPPVVEQAFSRSDGLVVEIDMLAVDPAQTQRLVAQHGLLLGDETLEDMLPPETLESLDEVLERRGMGLQSVERMRPWTVAMMLEEAQLAELGYEFANGIDLYFLRRAAEEKQIVSLETLESQITMLSMLSSELELRLLQDFLRDPEALRSNTQFMMDAWRRGDEAALEKVIFEHVDDDPEFAELYERLIFRRNVSMAKGLERLMQQPGTWFVVVGAGHFIGDRSVIALLKQKGHNIRRIP